MHRTRKNRCKVCAIKLSRKRPVPPRPSTKTLCGWCAQDHAGYNRQFRHQSVKQARCTQCGSSELQSKRLCAACLEKHNQRANQVRQQRRMAGLCRQCGKPAGDYACCEKCRQRSRILYCFDQMAAKWQAQREAGQRAQQWHEPEGMVWHWTGWEWELIPTPAY